MRNSVAIFSNMTMQRLSKTAHAPVFGKVHGIPIHVSGSGIAGTGVFADIPDEVNRLSAEMEGFQNEVASAASKKDPADQVRQFYTNQWTPFYESWKEFASKHQHWYRNMFLSAWHDTQEYRARFAVMVDAAKLLGMSVTVTPTPVRNDAFQNMYDEFKGAATSVWGVLKIILIVAAVAIGLGLILKLGGSTGMAAT